MTVLQINNIHYNYGSQAALRGITFGAPNGRITALLGPSGCGKTTLLKLIAGLLTPSEGDILLDGRSVVRVAAEKRNAVMVFQNHRLFPFMSVAENVGFGLKMRGGSQLNVDRAASEMLARVKLAGFEHRRPGQLSAGQQQRVALARALVVNPAVLLLDEPLSNLDAHLRDEMRELIRELHQLMQITTLLVTHDQAEAVQLADHMAVMFAGELQQCDEPRAFYDRPANQHVARFFGGVNFIPGIRDDGAIRTDLGPIRAEDLAQRCDQCGDRQGQCTLTIRPEHIQFADTLVAQYRVSRYVVTGQILESCYAGTHALFKVVVGNNTIQLTAPVDELSKRQPGAIVSLYLPPDKLWVLPQTG